MLSAITVRPRPMAAYLRAFGIRSVGHSVALVEVVLQAMAARPPARLSASSVRPTDGKVARMERASGRTDGRTDDGHDRIYTEELTDDCMVAFPNANPPTRSLFFELFEDIKT